MFSLSEVKINHIKEYSLMFNCSKVGNIESVESADANFTTFTISNL